ncbi:MAG: sulfatase [Planctomycetes bacterium]|nr:sulfatase [Planctomycetota bacterium]
MRSLVVSSIVIATLAAAQDSKRPNIVLLFADDAGWADFSMHRSTTHATPHIDRIAKEGVRCIAGYVSAPVCAPSRAGLLTGRYQQRFGFEFNLPGQQAKPGFLRGLPKSELTVATLLKKAGYRTGLIGKWHQGKADACHPNARGFDHFFGMIGGSSPYSPGLAKRIVRNRERLAAENLPYLTDAFGDEACAFMEKQASQTQPFFLFVSFNAPHGPMQPPEDAMQKMRPDFETKVRAANAAMTRSLDDNVGKILARLDSLKLARNTLVVFTNDNGGAMPYNGSLNEPYAGTKGTFLEGGVRVPFIVRWPGRLAAGKTYDAPVSTLDLLPTFCAAAGATLPADRTYDGVDLVPFLTGAKEGIPHEALFWRLDDVAAIRHGQWKLIRFAEHPPRLHDLMADPSERKNVAAGTAKVRQDLLARIASWEKQLTEPHWTRARKWRQHSYERYDQAKVDGWKRR